MFDYTSNICSECNQICKKTEYGSCVILCKEDIRLCMDCYFIFKEFEKLKKEYNLVHYLKMRELNYNLK
jgi:hypothetical protein